MNKLVFDKKIISIIDSLFIFLVSQGQEVRMSHIH